MDAVMAGKSAIFVLIPGSPLPVCACAGSSVPESNLTGHPLMNQSLRLTKPVRSSVASPIGEADCCRSC